jgi:hypothetical protein
MIYETSHRDTETQRKERNGDNSVFLYGSVAGLLEMQR